jgi:hypothetical protein
MAHLVTLTLLVDEADESRVFDSLNDMLRTAQQPVDDGRRPWLVDWTFGSVRTTLAELDDSIVNDTYAEGDLAKDWVAFSAKESAESEGAGYWSNKCGWTSLDLATKFDGSARDLPLIGVPDVIWMYAPYNSH